MERITFCCETITPMFLSGADGQTPELRAPSIKGALRFWWRAMHGNLGLKELKELEGKIFGDNGSRSCFTIRIENRPQRLNIIPARPVPHKTYEIPSIKEGNTFDVVLTIVEKPEFSFRQLEALFELMVIIGGVGKRSRRAMGGIKIVKKNINGIDSSNNEPVNAAYLLELIQRFSNHYQTRDNLVYNSFQGTMLQFPWIKEIVIGGNKGRNVPNVTSDATHEKKKKYGQKYEPNLGHAFNGRFASPVVVSVCQNSNTPIITTLNTVPDKGHRDLDVLVQNDFKNSIL